MIRVSMNIISDNQVLNIIPMYFEFVDCREFTNFIRDNALDILNWSHVNSYTKSRLKLGFVIIDDPDDDSNNEYYYREFLINCKNIDDYKNYISMTYDEFDSLIKSYFRDEKINSLLS